MRKTAAIILLSLSVILHQTVLASDNRTAASGQADTYKTRSELLMEAASHTGVLAPERAASVWAAGLKARSAAMQYAVMTEALKKEYARQLEALNSNWVTGMSSPWVESFSITGVNKPDNAHTEIELCVETLTSYGPPEFYGARLWLVREGGFWRVERVWADAELYPYTLLTQG